MKKLLHVYSFELGNYFKSKSYMISTILICVLAIIAISMPAIISAVKGGDSGEGDGSDKADSVFGESIALYDPEGIVTDDMVLSFGKTEIQRKDSEEQVKESVGAEDVAIGFVIRSTSEFDYYVFNRSMFDKAEEIFRTLMSTASTMKFCTENNLDYEEIERLNADHIVCNELVLGKDSEDNYWYSYALVILVFMVIVMYGMMIATSVANEKSNRTVEILVTSTSSSSLLFGKVFAGATAILFQLGLIFTSILGAYQINKESLGGMLDVVYPGRCAGDIRGVWTGRFFDLCVYVWSARRPRLKDRRFEQECRNGADARYDHLFSRAVSDAGAGRYSDEGALLPSGEFL